MGLLTALDVDAGPVFLLVERCATGLEVYSHEKIGMGIHDGALVPPTNPALAQPMRHSDFDCSAAIAEQLIFGRFVAFCSLTDNEAPSSQGRRLRSIA